MHTKWQHNTMRVFASPVSVILLSVEAVPIDFSELNPGAVEQVWMDLVEPQHAADKLLVKQKVAVHGLGHDKSHLRRHELHVSVALAYGARKSTDVRRLGHKLLLLSRRRIF